MRTPSSHRLLAWSSVLVALLMAGCTGGGKPATESSRQTSPADTSVPALSPGTADDVLEAVRQPGANAVLVNLWATWCIPCRTEFPELMRVTNDYSGRGLRTVLVSADFEGEETSVTRFLREQGVTFPSFIKTGDDMAFLEALEPQLTGALPATLVFDGSGKLVAFWEGQADYKRFEAAVLRAMQSTRPTSS